MPTLHVTNGDIAADTLRRIVDGVTITADPLHEGPAPAVDGEAWYEVRARFLAADGRADHEEIKRQLASWDRVIVDGCRAGDVVLWFEHDLFDQLLLVRTLDLVGGADRTAVHANVSLICIDSFPGVDRFIGLGQLSADQLATLVGTERPVTVEQYRLASEAWAAFRSPDPRDLHEIMVRLNADATYGGHLPFLGDALLRFLAEFPSVANGLSRTEELALGVLANGALEGGALFAASQAEERRPFMGDAIFFDIVRRLAAARVPLVNMSGPEELELRSQVFSISAAGRDVLGGRRDHIALNGIDRWRGGIHLVGRETSPWRWDARRQTLVS